MCMNTNIYIYICKYIYIYIYTYMAGIEENPPGPLPGASPCPERDGESKGGTSWVGAHDRNDLNP